MSGPWIITSIAAACVLVLVRYFRQLRKRRKATGKFSSYVSPELVQKVLADREKPRLEPRTVDVTVVVTNLTDSVGLYERLGDLPAVQVINLYMETMVPIIRRNDGFLNKMMGDKLLICFNAPFSIDARHPQRAIEAVLQMQKALDDLNDQLEHAGKPRLKMRAGISSGMATVGDLGSADASDYTVYGEVADRAAQLEQLCKIAGTRNLISLETASRVGDQCTLKPVNLPADSATPALAYEAIVRAKEPA